MPCTAAQLKSILQTALVRLNNGDQKSANSERAALEEKGRLRYITFIKDQWVGLSKEAESRRSSYRDRSICSRLWWMNQKLSEDTWSIHHWQSDDYHQFMISEHFNKCKDAFLFSRGSSIQISSSNTCLLWKKEKKKKKDILQTRDNRRDMMTGMKGKLERAAETMASCSRQKDNFETILALWSESWADVKTLFFCLGSALEALHIQLKRSRKQN